MQVELFQKIPAILRTASQILASWLNETLPDLDPDDWWSSLVLQNLSYSQSKRIKDRGIDTLAQLDLAALLRVLDSNWYQLSQPHSLSREDRNYTKEMSVIRNRWAHLDASDTWNKDDAYRDVDTLGRFIRIFDKKTPILQELNELKIQINATTSLSTNQPIPESKPAADFSVEKVATTNSNDFRPGQLVCLKSDPSRQGALLSIDAGNDDPKCMVFMDNGQKSLYLSQLETVSQTQVETTLSLNELHCFLSSLQVKHPSSQVLYSLNAARIDFVPYQFRPALKIIQSDQPRLLIADGVGVGKTIEAGLVLRELQARKEINSVLVICPKPLIIEEKWKKEMRRFDEKFTELNGRDLRFCIDEMDKDGEWPDRHRKTIIPYSLFDKHALEGKNVKTKKYLGLNHLDPPPQFDLVIVDEAHHIRNTSTYSHKAVRFFVENAEAVLFLSATPIQLDNQDLFVLLNLLRPDLVADRQTFSQMVRPNPFINKALKQARSGNEDWQQKASKNLSDAEATLWGRNTLSKNPTFHRVQQRLQGSELLREERVRTIQQIEGFNSFYRLISRTRRRDIEAFCVRRVKSHKVEFTASQKNLHDALLEFDKKALRLLHKTANVGFMISTLRRQASSCIFGLAPFIDDILNRRLKNFEVIEGIDAPNESALEISDTDIEKLRGEAQLISTLSSSLPDVDPKFEALKAIIDKKQDTLNNKIMIFSTFRHTLAYLHRKLVALNVRVGLIHGDIDDDERKVLRGRFEKSEEEKDAIDVMLFSEVGCEGLDYQFCHTMVNYDLPWNPMKIEQRIGRIDRRGQKSEVVSIHNLITSETIDADIYERCFTRIKIFEQNIGECDEILGEIHKGICEIVETTELSTEERGKRLSQLADNEIRKIEHQRELEERESELFGIRFPKTQENKAVHNAESPWIAHHSLLRLVSTYLSNRCGSGEHLLGEEPKTLRLSKEARNALLEDFRELSVKRTEYSRLWELWLKGNDQHCLITFDGTVAMQAPKALLITPTHPLVLQAADHFIKERQEDMVQVAFRVSTDVVDPGIHFFAIYAWEFVGVRPELQLVPICENEDIEGSLMQYIEEGIPEDNQSVLPTAANADAILKRLEERQRYKWKQIFDEHRENTEQLCAVQMASLEGHSKQRIEDLKLQLQKIEEPKIRTMRESQLERVTADFREKQQELNAALRKADIHTKCVAFGAIRVEN